MRRAAAIAFVLALGAGGCGEGTQLDDGAFTRDVSAIASSSAEGSLLARAIVRGSVPTATARVRVRDLSEHIDQADSQLEHAPAPRALRERVDAATAGASDAQDLLTRLYRSPTSDTARDVGPRLATIADRLEPLEVRS